MNEEILTEIETYKYLLKITEDLLVKGGYPKEILNKYYSLKEIKLSKIKENSPNHNLVVLNEENELSFTNHLKEKELELLEKMFDCIHNSISLFKTNIQILNLKENPNFEKNLENCALKMIILPDTPKNNSDVKDLNKILKIQNERFSKTLEEINEKTKNILEELKHSKEYIKDLEIHIKEVEKIEKQINIQKEQQSNEKEQKAVEHEQQTIIKEPKNKETDKEKIQKEISQYPHEYKKLSDQYVSLQIENHSYEERIKHLETQFLNQKEQYNQIIIDLQNKNQYLELKYDDILKESLENNPKNILSDFENFFNAILEKYSNIKESFLQQQSPNKYSDDTNIFNYKFLKFLFEKFEDDNMWLVGKLKELTQKNIELENKFSFHDESNSFQSTHTVKRDYKNLEIANYNYESAENQIKDTLENTKKYLQMIKKN